MLLQQRYPRLPEKMKKKATRRQRHYDGALRHCDSIGHSFDIYYIDIRDKLYTRLILRNDLDPIGHGFQVDWLNRRVFIYYEHSQNRQCERFYRDFCSVAVCQRESFL
jgi:hypothetical protein